jgi:hypothetical protein
MTNVWWLQTPLSLWLSVTLFLQHSDGWQTHTSLRYDLSFRTTSGHVFATKYRMTDSSMGGSHHWSCCGCWHCNWQTPAWKKTTWHSFRYDLSFRTWVVMSSIQCRMTGSFMGNIIIDHVLRACYMYWWWKRKKIPRIKIVYTCGKPSARMPDQIRIGLGNGGLRYHKALQDADWWTRCT